MKIYGLVLVDNSGTCHGLDVFRTEEEARQEMMKQHASTIDEHTTGNEINNRDAAVWFNVSGNDVAYFWEIIPAEL